LSLGARSSAWAMAASSALVLERGPATLQLPRSLFGSPNQATPAPIVAPSPNCRCNGSAPSVAAFVAVTCRYLLLGSACKKISSAIACLSSRGCHVSIPAVNHCSSVSVFLFCIRAYSGWPASFPHLELLLHSDESVLSRFDCAHEVRNTASGKGQKGAEIPERDRNSEFLPAQKEPSVKN
jgi:hypothetical protein